MSLNRKRKKELHKLQSQANNLWESQQVLVGPGREGRTRSESTARQLRPRAGRPDGAGRLRQVRRALCRQGRASSPSTCSPTRSSPRPVPSSAPPCRCGTPRTTPARASPRARASAMPDAATYCEEGRQVRRRRRSDLAARLGRRPAAEEGHRRRRRHRHHPRCRRRSRRALRRMADAACRRRALGRRRPAARAGRVTDPLDRVRTAAAARDLTIELRERPVADSLVEAAELLGIPPPAS